MCRLNTEGKGTVILEREPDCFCDEEETTTTATTTTESTDTHGKKDKIKYKKMEKKRKFAKIFEKKRLFFKKIAESWKKVSKKFLKRSYCHFNGNRIATGNTAMSLVESCIALVCSEGKGYKGTGSLNLVTIKECECQG